MEISTLIIDSDEQLIAELPCLLRHFPALQLIDAVSDTMQANRILGHRPVDLILIDPAMQQGKGMAFVRQWIRQAMFVFVTHAEHFAVEAFELGVIDYVLKPVRQPRFEKAISRLPTLEKQKGVTPVTFDHLFVRSEHQWVKVKCGDIAYIESCEEYIKIHVADGSTVLTRMTMIDVMKKLPSNYFVRIHRRYIVPLNKIKSVYNRKVLLGAIELPVGITYSDVIKACILPGRKTA